MITAVIGSGGKTSLIHALKDEYLKQGKKVFVTTTTHMYVEDDTITHDDPNTIIDKLNTTGFAMAGLPASDNAKIGPLSLQSYHRICEYADEVLVESDGSKHFPLKYPKENEPVIPDNVNKIIIVCGLHGLNKKASGVVFRLEKAPDLLGIHADTIITPSHIQELIRKGYLEKLMTTNTISNIEIHATHDGSLYQRAIASLLKADMDVSLIKKEWFQEKPCLFICGAGHVAKELADIANKLDFRIVIFDSRKEFACKERFPYAEKVICDDYTNLDKCLIADSYYAILTPGHQDDYTCLRAIINSNYHYLGMIGSKGKVAKNFDNLRNDGVSEELINTVHAPIGLPIKAATPSEIAISILAEIIQIKNAGAVSSASSALINSTESGTLCIIIDKTGSAPRGIGSMMLVTANCQIDTIGGGAVENAAIADAREITTPTIKQYVLNNNDAQNIGMICGGTNKILFIPV